MTPDEAVPVIEQEMKTIIEAATLPVTLNDILIGQKERSSNFNPPLIWIFAEDSPIDLEGAYGEVWRFRYVVVAVVVSFEPPAGKALAEELALKATDALIKNRTLNGTVRDVRRITWVPGDERIQNEDSLFGAGVQLEIMFDYCTTSS